MHSSETNRFFWKLALPVFFLSAAFVYVPVFAGFVPFPSGLVFDFPLFAPSSPSHVVTKVADIGDLVSQFYPYRTMLARAVREGSLPLWNPYMLSGTAFEANPLSALFYPLNIFYYLLPTAGAWSLGFLLRSFLSGLFTALFVREIGGTATGSITAGLLFTFSGFMTVWQGQTMIDAFIWLPLICYAVVRLHKSRSRTWVVLTAIALAMPALAGHPESAVHLTLTAIAFAFFLAFTGFAPWQFICHFIGAGILSLGIVAVQLLPSLQWFSNVNGLHAVWPSPPAWSLMGLVSRDIIPFDIRIHSNSFGLELPIQATYIGMMGFIAAPIALLSRSRKFVVFFVFWSGIALSAAYGIGPTLSIVHQIPLLRNMKHDRLVMLFVFGMAVLAGLGIAVVEQLEFGDHADRIKAIVLAGVGLYVAGMMIYAVHRVTIVIPEPLRTPKASFLFLLASGAIVIWTSLGYINRTKFKIAALALVGLDVCSFAYGSIPFERSRNIVPRNQILDRLSTDEKGPFRIAQVGGAFPSNWQLMYGLHGSDGYEISLTRIKQFTTGLATDNADGAMFIAKDVLENKDRRIDMLNTKYLVVSEWDSHYTEFRKQPERFRFLYTYGDTDVYENLKVLPRAYLVQTAEAEVIPDESSQLERLKDPRFDPEHRVVLAEPPQQPQSSALAPALRTPRVEWRAQGVNSFEMDVNPVVPSVLVVSQMDYPGWKAYIDGESVPITRADYAFPAIFVGPGLHRVRFSFEPWTFRWGLTISILAVTVVLACVSGLGRIRFRQSG